MVQTNWLRTDLRRAKATSCVASVWNGPRPWHLLIFAKTVAESVVQIVDRLAQRTSVARDIQQALLNEPVAESFGQVLRHLVDHQLALEIRKNADQHC